MNNPAAFADPSGLQSCWGWECAVGGYDPPPQPPCWGWECAIGGYDNKPDNCWGWECQYSESPLPGQGPRVSIPTDAPPLTEEEVDALIERAEEISEEVVTGTAMSDGACAEGQVQLGIAWVRGGCLIWDGEKFALLGFDAIGAGTPYAGGSAGILVSNAESYKQLLGNSWCIGVGGGSLGSGAVEACFNYTDDWSEYTGIWTVSGSVGVSTPGVDVHITAVRTTEVTAFANPLEPVQSWWENTWQGLATFGRPIP